MKIFISHASADTWVARQIALHIKPVGGEVFLDETDIHHGDDFRERILETEPGCSELLVLLTPWSMQRPWVLLEISCFLHSRKRIVGVVHGLSIEEARAVPAIGALMDRRTLMDINQLDTYFAELQARMIGSGVAEANR
jgi:hypothetical protein